MSASTQTCSNARANLTDMTRGSVQNLLDIELTSGFATTHVYADSYTVPTTAIDDANDILRLFKFPAGAYLWQLRITATDMDTNATPTLVFDILAIDDSDTTKQTLINDTTIGQGAGSDSLDEAQIGKFVGNYWLALKTGTAAATAAAGTLKVVALYSLGVMTSAAGLNPKMTDGSF